jgi:hypothetical protein
MGRQRPKWGFYWVGIGHTGLRISLLISLLNQKFIVNWHVLDNCGINVDMQIISKLGNKYTKKGGE